MRFCEFVIALTQIITARVRSTREGNVLTPVCVSVHTFGGGGWSQVQVGGGVSGLRFFGEGGPKSQIFGGRGDPGLRFWGGGPRSQVFFLGGSQVSDFLGGYPVSVKGKIFDTRFGLIHVQTRKFFLSRDPPPPSSKGKNF